MSRLSDFALKSLPVPKSGQTTYSDGGSPLLVRVSQGGAKTFLVMLGSGRRHTIGRYGDISLQQARAAAVRLKAEKALGRSVPDAMSIASAREFYLAQLDVRPKTMEYYRYHLAKLKGDRVAEVKTRDITKLLDPLSPASRIQALASFRPFFKWCAARSYIERSPCESLTAPRTPSRDRVLLDQELQCIWRAVEQCCLPTKDEAGVECSSDDPAPERPVLDTTFPEIVRLLILTGQRKSEIAGLRRSWLADRSVTLPKHITKNGREHTFPTGTLTARLLETRRKGLEKKDSFLFPVQGLKTQTSFTGWSKAKRSLDKALGPAVEPWTLHDLRRTYATNMARLGVRLEVTEKLLNHISGSQSGIVGVYQRYNFWPEMVEASERYEAWLSKLVGARPGTT